MKKLLQALCLTCVLLATSVVSAGSQENDLQKPVPPQAQKLLADGARWAELDRFQEAETALRKAIAMAPSYVNAHAEYIQLKANFMWRYDEVRAEYESLMKREPENPVYPMALAIAQYQTREASRKAWLEKVVRLASGWAWAYYARALLILEKEPEKAVEELKKYIETDGSWLAAYITLSFIQERTLKKMDDAVATAEKMAARPEARSWNLLHYWKLRLGKDGATEEARAALRTELSSLASTSKEVKILDAVRQAYSSLLNDKDASQTVENKIRQIDPSWYPERGRVLYIGAQNISGAPRLVVAVNRAHAFFNKIMQFEGEIEPNEKITGLEGLLSDKPVPEMRRYLYEKIFRAAEKAGNTIALIKYGKLLYQIDPTDAAVPAKIAIALANQKKDLTGALQYARLAEQATAVFRPLPAPANSGFTSEEWHKERFTDEQQQRHFKKLRSLALDALGWALSHAGRCSEAEARLRQSTELDRNERNLYHLAEILVKLGRNLESEQIALEAKNVFAESIKKKFKSEPAKDFELTAIDGRKIKLSDQKGKVVLVDFWATWCGPCVRSAPVLNKLYEKYKEKGLEILYISVDDRSEIYKVAPFAREHKLGFPVLLDQGVKELYNVRAFPTSIFIDRNGNVRYRDIGFNSEESPRMLETIIELLLEKTSEAENAARAEIPLYSR